eukprot:CAMPEP_0117458144 /NCGR_PEP_ID=MMETSP0784-20121206/776_1 /TAXON_ID=39447 /ORGANISM="" /LENGTH=604 /DNA_ID=CAMNT_0005251647 /DNA_START=240 /DNA_END=2051 /DNA_ORIENTATION=+
MRVSLCVEGSLPATSTADQLLEFTEVFKLADANGNGRIDSRELQAAMRVLGLRLDRQRAERIMSEFDSNGDGEIDFKEFLRVLSSQMHSVDDDVSKALDRGRFLSRWSALLFDDDGNMDSMPRIRVARVAKHLTQTMTDNDLQGLLDENTPTRRSSDKRQQLMRLEGALGTGGAYVKVSPVAWPDGKRARVRHAAELILVEVAAALMRFRPTARVLAFILQFRIVSVALTPFMTRQFLRSLFRHRFSAQALTTLLLQPRIEVGVSHILRFDAALAGVCEDVDAPQLVGRFVGTIGLGAFFRRFILAAEPCMLRRFLRHKSTAVLVAKVVSATAPVESAAWVHKGRATLPGAIGRACLEPGAELWAMNFCSTLRIDEWLGGVLIDPRGATFAHQLLLSPGFIDRVDDFLGLEDAKRFVIRLLQQPGVHRFVTWLNRDATMREWFARIAKRENAMRFIAEMLLEPGLDRFIVSLLLRRGNDVALRSMLDQWVHKEGSFAQVFGSFARKPGIEQALARVVISPGFLDGFVLSKFLWQPGLIDLALEALALVGLRGLQSTVLPLLFAVAVAAIILAMQNMLFMSGNLDLDSIDLDAAFALLEDASIGD